MVLCNNRQCTYCTENQKCAWDLAGREVCMLDGRCMSYRRRPASVRITDLMRAPVQSNCHGTQSGYKSNSHKVLK